MNERRWTALAFVLLLACAWFAYAPGLTGGFLFDDFVNLDKLASPGAVDNWPAFWRYITAGTADPTGRPLALLTFLLDATNWPADPAPFLRTNVLLHLLNGALLFQLLRGLGRDIGDAAPRADATALLGAGLWTLHPLFVSTTLYIVQREAMLPATCTLLALLAYLHGRRNLARAPRTAIAWMVAGIAGGTLLATLCKANGIVVPLLAWVVEGIALRSTTTVRPPAWFSKAFLVAPSIAVIAYVASYLRLLHTPIEGRPWLIAERLLTEPRVLVDYLHLLVVPRVLSTGVYNDGYPIAHLTEPATLGAIALVCGLVALAITMRRVAPVACAATLFYFAGHLLESTTIPLELYFEHRNYLPALLLGWPLARAIVHWRVAPGWRLGVALALLGLCGTMTWQRATIWGQPDLMTALWARQNAASSRAQANAAMFEVSNGREGEAVARLAPLWRASPADLQLALNYTSARCATGGLSRQDVAHVAWTLAHFVEGGQLAQRWLGNAIAIARDGSCSGLDLAAVQSWLDAAWRNPRLRTFAGRRQDLHSLGGQLALARGDHAKALREFNLALDAAWSPDAAGLQASYLAMAGDYRGALAHLDHFEAQPATRPHGWSMQRVHAWVLERQRYWPNEFALLRRKLEAELHASPDAPPMRSTAE